MQDTDKKTCAIRVSSSRIAEGATSRTIDCTISARSAESVTKVRADVADFDTSDWTTLRIRSSMP